MGSKFKIVMYVPESHADELRKAVGDAGAGQIGNYSYCSFSTKGVGRFTPTSGANPTIGKIDSAEEVLEERIEVVCAEENLEAVLVAIKEVHPYEESATDVYKLEG